MPNWKAKGSKGERELVKFFNEQGWVCVRVAGSGSSIYPAPDILAGNAIRRVAIECKVTKDAKKYFTNEEIKQLSFFATKFGAEAWVGVKFAGEDWFFLMLEDLEETGKHKVITKEKARLRGLRKEDLIG